MKKKDKIIQLKLKLEESLALLYEATLRLSSEGYDGNFKKLCADFISLNGEEI
jgi:hypothetical protein